MITGKRKYELSGKLEALKDFISAKGSILVSYSGGVDSSLLAAVTSGVLGPGCKCVFLDSPVVPRRARADAERLAGSLGLSLEIVPISIMDNKQFRENPPSRCYFCKKESAKLLKQKAKEYGMACIADGINISDLGEHRPGLEASNEEGFFHPFLETGITKDDIRAIARNLGYEFWNKPSAACLSSRIPYGYEITKENLSLVEQAEDYLADMGFSQFRVRNHGGIARIEMISPEFAMMMKNREEIALYLKKIGFSYVTVDLEGYRSGSMDEVL